MLIATEPAANERNKDNMARELLPPSSALRRIGATADE
jgi:hypothetical protein